MGNRHLLLIIKGLTLRFFKARLTKSFVALGTTEEIPASLILPEYLPKYFSFIAFRSALGCVGILKLSTSFDPRYMPKCVKLLPISIARFILLALKTINACFLGQALVLIISITAGGLPAQL